MNLSRLAGNEALKRRMGGDELSHAYILSGPNGSGRHTLAHILAQAAVCRETGAARPCGVCLPCRKALGGNHPDIQTLRGADGKPVTVEQVRRMRADVYIRPNEGARKVYILDDAQLLNRSAQNALLKVLEDGPDYALFLLIAGDAGGILETVRSRCQSLSLLPPGDGNETAHEPDGAAACAPVVEALLAALRGTDELALYTAALELDKQKRDALAQIWAGLLARIGQELAHAPDRARLVRAAQLIETLRGAAQVNVGGGQLGGWLCAGMHSK